MLELQDTEGIAPNAASTPLKGTEADTRHHKGQNGQEKGTTGRQQQRQSRTRFSSIQRNELERAFNQSSYVTPHSCHMLLKLGIPKRTIMVWFKNKRVALRKEMLGKWCSSQKHLKPAASCTPVISAHQSSILQSTNCEVQNTHTAGPSFGSPRKNGPYSSTGKIVNGSVGCTNMTLSEAKNCAYNENTWSHWETSSAYNCPSHVPSPASIHTTPLSYDSSGINQTQLSTHSNVPWLDNATSETSRTKLLTHSNAQWIKTVPDVRSSCPLIHRDSQRAGPSNSLGSSSSQPPLPLPINATTTSYDSSGMNQTQLSTHSNVPWSDNAPGLTASLPLIHQGDHWAPEGYQDPGQQLWDHTDSTHSIPQGIVPQIPEASSHMGVVHCGTSIIDKCSSHPPLPHLINSTAVSYGSSGMDQTQLSTHFNVHVSWSDNAPGLTASLPLLHQGNHWAPEGYQDPGQQLGDHTDRTHSIPQGIVPQVPEAPSHSTPLMCAPQHDLNYTSLLDDLLDVLQSDLAAHNNIVAPHFLTNAQNSTVSLPQSVNPVM